MNEEDRAWARSLASGDPEAFRLLAERETTRVFRTCYRVLGQVEAAEEATQEVFALAYRALGTYRGQGRPSAWLLRIAIRESWRLAALQARRRSSSVDIDDSVLAIPAVGADPGELVIAAQQEAWIRQAVIDLPEPYREIITLRYFGELSLQEICIATGRPEGTVKAQIHRGLERLRRHMDEMDR